MSYHNNLKQEKCWSCEFFCGERSHKTGFLGDSTQTSSQGSCSCKRSSHYNKSISESGFCSKYQKWGVIASALAKKENDEFLRKQREERQRNEREKQEEQRRAERERRELERERIALEQERKRLEYERWYATLSPAQKEQEDLRIKEERIREERETEALRIRREQEEKAREVQRLIDEDNAKTRRKKTLIIVFSLIGAVILLIVGICVGKAICNSIQFKNSSTGLLTSYLSNKANYSNGTYGEYVDIEGRGRIVMTIEYKKSGFVDNYGQTCDFRVTTFVPPKEGDQYSELYGFFFFNLDGSDNRDSFGTWEDSIGHIHKSYPNYCARAHFGSGSVLIQYQEVTYESTTGQLEHSFENYEYTNWDKSYRDCLKDWTNSGWSACKACYSFANELVKEAIGHGLYE